jgi:hypothetical protein
MLGSPALGTAAIVTAVLTALGVVLRYVVPAFIALRAMKHYHDIEIQSGLKGLTIKTRKRNELKRDSSKSPHL